MPFEAVAAVTEFTVRMLLRPRKNLCRWNDERGLAFRMEAVLSMLGIKRAKLPNVHAATRRVDPFDFGYFVDQHVALRLSNDGFVLLFGSAVVGCYLFLGLIDAGGAFRLIASFRHDDTFTDV